MPGIEKRKDTKPNSMLYALLHQVLYGKTNMDEDIVKSLNDRRNYRVVNLHNGLTALLISDISNEGSRNQQTDNEYTETDHQVTITHSDVVGGNCIDGVGNYQDDSSSDETNDTGSDGSDDESMQSSDIEVESTSKANKCKGNTVNKETKLAAGALCVGIGSFFDPDELPGLAHFLEHMVFMGSEKYPDENSFDAFIKKHGGSTNAFTDCERTVFTFDIRPKYLKETLDRFAQFFISPLMKRNSIDRELIAVDSEFQMNYQSDEARKMQLLGSLTTTGHPFRKFLWGSEKSLKIMPEEMGIDVYGYLQSFWKRMYCSNYMTMAVISNEDLNLMENWIREIFTPIPKCDLPQPNFQDCKIFDESKRESFRSEFDVNKFHRLYKVVPVKDIHRLEITWEFPSLHKYYRTKPMNYVSWLLGHESDGSVLTLLKDKGWATSLCCGNSGSGHEFNSLYSLFACLVNLTASGLEHYLECATIIFQYLEMLRQVGPQPRIFSEIKQIEDNSFRFKEEVDTVDYVEEIAECMQLYPPNDYLTGRHLVWDFDKKIINHIQNNLVPEKANIMLISKNIATECTKEEKWFGTRFSSQVLDHEVEESWKNLDLHPSLHLPKENMFIATNFDILTCEMPSKYPVIVHESTKGKVWYKQDQKFLMPKAKYCFYLKSPILNESPQMMVLAELYCLLLDLDMKHVVYDADVAGLYYGTTVYECGIELSFAGFSDKLPSLFQKVVENMFRLKTAAVHFNMVKEQLTRAYYNRVIKPQKFVRATRLKILQEVKWTDLDKRKVICNITLDHFKEFLRAFKSKLYVESLFQGNLTEQDAVAHQEYIYRNLAFEPLPVSRLPQVRVLQLPDGESICKISGYNKNDQNTVITNYYQIGPASGKDLAYTNLLIDMMEEPCFDSLRTKQQLGYSVFCTCRETFGILGFSITIQTQAEKYGSDFVKERVDMFLNDFMESLKTLDPQVLEHHITSMIEIKKHDDLNLGEEVSRNWKEVMDETYIFDRLDKEIEYLKLLTKEKFIEWVMGTAYDILNMRKLSVQVLGHKRKHDSFVNDSNTAQEEIWSLKPLAESDNGKQCISDINLFKENLPVFPVSKFY